MSIGKRISKARKDLNISQEKLADLIFVSRQSVSKWESNQVIPDTENIITLAKVLKVSVEWIISGNEHSSRYISIKDYIVLIIGITFLALSIILIIINPYPLLETSSTIEFKGFGVLVVISVIIILWGIKLAYKRKK